MNKNLLAVLFFVCYASLAGAQVTLTAGINPFWGDEFISHVCNNNGVSPGTGGAAHTWNFNTLTTTQVDTGTAESCESTGMCSTFPGSSCAVVTPGLSTIEFLIDNATVLSQNGLFQSATQFVSFTDPIDEIRYPFNYLDSFKDTYAGTVTYMGVAGHQSGIIDNVYDGYGTLVLPGGVTYTNVARIHSSQTFSDSVELLGSIGPFNVETYTWYEANYHSALLTINTLIGPGVNDTLVSYAALQLHDLVPSVTTIASSLQLFPNPVENELNIKFSTPSGAQVRISLLDMVGREVALVADQYAQGTQNITYNTTSLPKGLYLVRLQSGAETVTRKLSVQ